MCLYPVASVVSNSVQSYGLQPARLLYPRDPPGKNTGVGCHALRHRIFPTQGSNLCLLCLPALAGGFFTTSATWEAQNKLGNTTKKQTHRYREQISAYQWEEGNEKGQQREGG